MSAEPVGPDWVEYVEFCLGVFDPAFVSRDWGVTAPTMAARLDKAGRPDLADRFRTVKAAPRVRAGHLRIKR